MEEEQIVEKADSSYQVNELIKIRYGFYIAIFGLTVAAIVAVFMMFFKFNTASDIVAVVGVFTSIMGTIVGAFIGVEIGSTGIKTSEQRNMRLEKEKEQIIDNNAIYKSEVYKVLSEVDKTLEDKDKISLPEQKKKDLENLRIKVNRVMSSSNYIINQKFGHALIDGIYRHNLSKNIKEPLDTIKETPDKIFVKFTPEDPGKIIFGYKLDNKKIKTQGTTIKISDLGSPHYIWFDWSDYKEDKMPGEHIIEIFAGHINDNFEPVWTESKKFTVNIKG